MRTNVDKKSSKKILKIQKYRNLKFFVYKNHYEREAL